jgi:hypothetical protein
MAFLDNSGDIILDAVLTDTGRFRLAKGDGSFRIVKFALGDDEVDYTKYNRDHASGSAYFDLEVLQTPVFEAFTNNTSTMKSKLISIPRTNLLYLPVLKLNKQAANTEMYLIDGSSETFLVAVDEDSEKATSSAASTTTMASRNGVLAGENPSSDTDGGSLIRIDQGLDTSDIPAAFQLDSDLVEQQYIIEIDNRLGSIHTPAGAGLAPVSFIDDDNIASYYLSLTTNPGYVSNNDNVSTDDGTQTISGPRGSSLRFKIQSSLDLNTSTTLFTKLGSTATIQNDCFYYIDSNVRVTGATTGYRIDIPVRFIKLKSDGAC